MRIGTWNLEGRFSRAHRDFVERMDADVWLLTEVHPSVELSGFWPHRTTGVMGRGQHWAGVYSRRPLTGLPDVHVATAAAIVDGTTFCSTILPWHGLGSDAAWPGDSHADRTGRAIDRLLERVLTRRVVWGGDWNHALFGPEQAGGKKGRAHVFRALSRLELNVPTAHLPHRIPGLLSIDHVAVPADRAVLHVERVSAEGLSDHDCYVVELAND
ncbi:endonuclease/exonuclease/phosphatase family protein [Geodermatophilus sp. DSM 44513]|uniref:endonuclease/exonuclease/phosphatase family protein n=1 Tax=Geodermatophilus sp. DSM 44513 TaxID=1528104 RepID=UPI00127B60BE|nr:endonuclease/exonuclease/phosphatase family protein [Geodermatophilus sp. DSM 44513]WNV74131.1 hypothetical protein RTG05_14160 [Geodermatophilus sp. DSM 44513]